MRFMVTTATLVLVTITSSICQAQTSTTGAATFVGTSKAKAGCPVTKVHIIRNDKTLTGVVFFADGTGISSVKGATDGQKFNYTMTSISGHGPTGEVTGTVSADGMVSSHVVGTDCVLTGTVPRYADVLDRGG